MVKLFSLLEVLIFLIVGVFFGIISTIAYYNPIPISTNQNGTFVLNGTDEYYYLQYMEYNKKQLMQSYDLQQVIVGNFCEEPRGYITDITPQSFRLQCCQNFTSCKNYVIVNKNIEEVRLR